MHLWGLALGLGLDLGLGVTVRVGVDVCTYTWQDCICRGGNMDERHCLGECVLN